ncbi:MAG TPA: di-heme oxidoredictase family protein [Steroidobacteraceae bacterium]|nr:di-heme oxidoredictase family protein [Steroidobacteraceae bacterium]
MITLRTSPAALAVIAALPTAVLAASPVPEWLSSRSGGDTSVALTNENAFAQPLPTLPTEDLRKFTFGNRLFNTNWVAAPSSVDAFDGLGPVFNRVSCSSCHTRDGRGKAPESSAELFESILLRLSLPGTREHGGAVPVPAYGEQLNEKAVSNVPAEGHGRVSYAVREGKYPDGTVYSLAVPTYSITDLTFGSLPANVQISPRVAPPVFGLGLLEAVPDETLRSLADPEDANGDGISGRMNIVWDPEKQTATIGRFGWKANQPSVHVQNAAAALNDIGLTTTLFARENVVEGQTAAAAAPTGGAPEVSDEFLARLDFYTRTLAVPAARDVGTPPVQSGAAVFAATGCVACHVPTLETAAENAIPALANQTIHPFTDLLLHDMGPELADGRPDYAATGSEWRTAPLWGIGLTATVNRHTRFLHDGRARSLTEAILWHGGEAARARDSFMHLPRAQRAALLQFLNSL